MWILYYKGYSGTRGSSILPPGSKKMKNIMHDNILSITLGALTACLSSMMFDKVMEMLILSFIGGIVGWIGGKIARWIDKKCECLFRKKK